MDTDDKQIKFKSGNKNKVGEPLVYSTPRRKQVGKFNNTVVHGVSKKHQPFNHKNVLLVVKDGQDNLEQMGNNIPHD